ncbi:MAG: hypothetical protein EZS28_036477, partial [Streblomastix strix]
MNWVRMMIGMKEDLCGLFRAQSTIHQKKKREQIGNEAQKRALKERRRNQLKAEKKARKQKEKQLKDKQKGKKIVFFENDVLMDEFGDLGQEQDIQDPSLIVSSDSSSISSFSSHSSLSTHSLLSQEANIILPSCPFLSSTVFSYTIKQPCQLCAQTRPIQPPRQISPNALPWVSGASLTELCKVEKYEKKKNERDQKKMNKKEIKDNINNSKNKKKGIQQGKQQDNELNDKKNEINKQQSDWRYSAQIENDKLMNGNNNSEQPELLYKQKRKQYGYVDSDDDYKDDEFIQDDEDEDDD